jgi:hypothetical protein
MPLSVDQIMAVSYPTVLREFRRLSNQWGESALLRELERTRMIQQVELAGPGFQAVFEYQPYEPNICEDDGSDEVGDEQEL